jgi:hypothetical protein
MAITHGSAIRDAVCNAVVDAIDVGGAGKLIFQTAASVAAATLNMSATAFGAAASGSATANAIASDTNAAGGTTTKFVINSGAGTMIISGSVGTSASDINLSSTNIGVGDTVSVSSLTYTAMP